MRLLIVSGIFHPDVGGPATYLHGLARALTARGDEIGVVTYGEPDPPGRYPFPVWRVSRRGSPATRILRFVRALADHGRRFPVWYVNDYGLPAWLAARWLRPVVVMKVVGDFAWEYSRRHGLVTDGIDDFQTRSYGLRVAALKRLQRSYVRCARRVIVPSRYLEGIVTGWGVPVDRMRVVYNAVSLDAIPHVSVPRPPGPLLLTAGRLAPWKGMRQLLEIVSLIGRDLPAVRLAVAGDGPMASTLREQARRLELGDTVLWLGSLERPELLAWMRAADAFVLLSEYEGFPHVAIEAMTTGLPVALSKAGGNPELVTDGENGLLLDPDDHPASARRLLRLLTDDAHRADLARRARARAGDFEWPVLLSETLAVLQDVEPDPAGADR